MRRWWIGDDRVAAFSMVRGNSRSMAGKGQYRLSREIHSGQVITALMMHSSRMRYVVDAEEPLQTQWRNCGALLSGAFCAACGQAKHDGHPTTMGHFVHDAIHEFVHLDGTIFRTLKALFFQPGRLREEYWSGHVVSWVRPIRIFLVAAALHLLVATGVGPLNLQVLLDRRPDGQLNVSVGNGVRELARPGGNVAVSEEERKAFFEKFEHDYAAIRYVSVLLFALASWLLYRGHQRYFASHLIASLHLYSFWYLLAILVSLPGRFNPTWNWLIRSSVFTFSSLWAGCSANAGICDS